MPRPFILLHVITLIICGQAPDYIISCIPLLCPCILCFQTPSICFPPLIVSVAEQGDVGYVGRSYGINQSGCEPVSGTPCMSLNNLIGLFYKDVHKPDRKSPPLSSVVSACCCLLLFRLHRTTQVLCHRTAGGRGGQAPPLLDLSWAKSAQFQQSRLM
jgi:hypothetical protein